jgi:hypothetical protein
MLVYDKNPPKSSTNTCLEFPEFSKQGIPNVLMFHDNFESLDELLISLCSLALALTPSGLTG